MTNPVDVPVDRRARVSVRCETMGSTTERPPAVREHRTEGLTTDDYTGVTMADPKSTHPTAARLTIPRIRVDRLCGDLGPRYSCTRPEGHTGRHLYAWRNAGPLTGRVRDVWGDR